MRHPIEKSPRDGTAIILEDDASGTCVAHWSTEAGQWVGENGEPTKITPTHWNPMPRDQYLLREDERSGNQSRVGRGRLLAAFSITVTLVAAALIVTHFRAEVAAYVARYVGQVEADQASAPAETQQAAQVRRALGEEQQRMAVLARELTASAEEHRRALGEERARRAALARELATAQRENERQAAALLKARDETARLNQPEAAKSARSLEEEREKAAALALEAAAARKELTASTEQSRQALEAERARGIALASELAAAQRENEKQAALLKASDETARLKQAEAAKGAPSLEEERKKAAALALEAAAVRKELAASTEQSRQALEAERARGIALARELATAQREIEVKAAQLRQAGAETGQIKQATERATAELRQSLRQERDRTAAMAGDLESARRTVDARVAPEPVASSSISKTAQAAEVVAMVQPTVGVQGSPEATRLVARASALLGQGDIGAARTVLERAVETGSAQASFMLAETYDPGILSAWGTYGTRGEVTKARELYAKAHAGGIQEAKDRLSALRQ